MRADDQPYVRNLARLLGQLLDRIEHFQHTLRRNRYSITGVWAALTSHKGTHVNLECGCCAGLGPILRLKYVSELTERLNEVDCPKWLEHLQELAPLAQADGRPHLQAAISSFSVFACLCKDKREPDLKFVDQVGIFA